MDKAIRTQPLLIFLTLIVFGLPAYGGDCSAEEYMQEYKNYFSNPEYKPKPTEWIRQTRTYKAVIDGKNELRCRYGGEVKRLLNTESYTCGPIRILHTQIKELRYGLYVNVTYSYALIDRKNNEFQLNYNKYEKNNETCRCVYGPTNTIRTTICTQKLYNDYVNIDFIEEIPETERTKPRPQI